MLRPPTPNCSACHGRWKVPFCWCGWRLFWLPRSVQLVPASDGGRYGGLGDLVRVGCFGIHWPTSFSVHRLALRVDNQATKWGWHVRLLALAFVLLSGHSLWVRAELSQVQHLAASVDLDKRLVFSSTPLVATGEQASQCREAIRRHQNCPIGSGVCVCRIPPGWLSQLGAIRPLESGLKPFLLWNSIWVISASAMTLPVILACCSNLPLRRSRSLYLDQLSGSSTVGAAA